MDSICPSTTLWPEHLIASQDSPPLICLLQITAHKLGACWQIESFRKNWLYSSMSNLTIWMLAVSLIWGGVGKFPILPLISRVNCCHIDWLLYHWSRWVLWSLLSLIADRLRRTIWPDSFVCLTASQGQRVIGQIPGIWCAQGALWDILRSWKRRCVKPDLFSRRRPTYTNNPETHKPTRTPPQLLKYTSVSWTCICNVPDCVKIDGKLCILMGVPDHRGRNGIRGTQRS